MYTFKAAVVQLIDIGLGSFKGPQLPVIKLKGQFKLKGQLTNVKYKFSIYISN